jgi:hypothetical protein
MKKVFAIVFLSVSIYFVPAWNGSIAQAPLNFQGSLLYSPVISHEGSGSWEELTAFLPFAFIHDGIVYMFYTGLDMNGVSSIGLATSSDGYFFDKYYGNPVFTPSSSGFDSYCINQGIVIEDVSGWIMYYNARELPGNGPGPSIGRATSQDLTGPWVRSSGPVLSAGSPGEWDSEFIVPNNVFPLDNGGFIMFYSAGDNFMSGSGYQIGLATSTDGIAWTKYNDPSTTTHPYAESDPVLKTGAPGEWDSALAWECSVQKKAGGYDMYYSGFMNNMGTELGYATSPDGISWTKYASYPVFTIENDPYATMMEYTVVEQPTLLIIDTTVFMYYDYGPPVGEIGVATAEIPVGINDRTMMDDGVRITNFPNPITHSTILSYELKETGHVTIQIFNSFGQLVAEPLNCNQTKGEQKVTLNVGNYPAGLYFYCIKAGQEVGGGKMVKY